jgi:6-phosphogluconolactonase (cycloisomerase 2 family)
MKRIILGCIGAWMLNACASVKQNDAMENMYLLVGSYATPQEEGIKVYAWDNEKGEATYVSGLTGISNPSYQVVSADGSHIYSVGEDDGLTSTAHALSFDKANGKLTMMNTQLTQGGAPCYINIAPDGKSVVTANYMGANISFIPLETSGRLSENVKTIAFTGEGEIKNRQDQPHLHCVEFTPDGKFLLANDLGTDKIHVFPLVQAGKPDEKEVFDVNLEPASGPRHICFSKDGRFAYLINEISGKVTTLSYDGKGLTPIQYIEADTVNAQGSADIHLSPDGKFLYASNRLKADGIAIFSVNQETGLLTKVGYQLTGIHPRNFIITPGGRFLLVACRDSNVVQIFKRDEETGLLVDTGKKIGTGKPVCLKFI